MNFKTISTIIIASLFLSGVCWAKTAELLGAGATFPEPLYIKMFDAYHKATGVEINYQGIGSGGGIRQLSNKTVDFGASDAYLSDLELTEISGKVLHIPTCLGGVVLIYNLPGNPQLRFTPELISKIFLGKIKSWNDPLIKKVNPGVNLPALRLMVVHRSDGSGTTAIFTDYLAKISKEWKSDVGAGKSIGWPTGLGAKGNAGVSGLVKQTPGAIGYTEHSYAIQNKMVVGTIQNAKGNFIEPSIASVRTAADTAIPADTRVSITNTDNPNGYPISGFTWILVYKDQNYNRHNLDHAKTVVNLLGWMVHDGQQYTEALNYSPLPESVQQKAEAIIKSMTFSGKKI